MSNSLPDHSARGWLRSARGNRSLRDISVTEFGSGWLSLLEQGKRSPNVMQIPRLAHAYGMDPLVMAKRFMEEATDV